MIIRDLHIEGIPILPPETDPILVVDPHAELSLAVSLQRLQPVGRNRGKITKLRRAIDLNQFSKRDRRDLLEPADTALLEDRLRVRIVKGPDQTSIVLRFALDPLVRTNREKMTA